MATYTPAARNQVVDAHCKNSGALWYSLHSADPGTTGANEVPGAARKLDSFPDAVGGETTSVGRLHDVPPDKTITHFGRWTASSGGTFHSGGPLSGTEVYGPSGGQYAHSHKVTGP
jgi:hypothetical protein